MLRYQDVGSDALRNPMLSIRQISFKEGIKYDYRYHFFKRYFSNGIDFKDRDRVYPQSPKN